VLRIRSGALVPAALLVLLAVGCTPVQRDGAVRFPHLAGTTDYLPGVAADVFLPTATRAPVVVLVPGGGWASADRTGLRPLADALAGDGLFVVAATYRTGRAGARFPVPVADVLCAARFAVERARRSGIRPGPVVLLGHSAGAQLAAVAALSGDRFAAACPYPATAVDAFAGLAGAYDLPAPAEQAWSLFGASPQQRPDLWRQGDPATWAAERTGARALPVLLVHGAADDLVPASVSTTFGERLRRAGHWVQVVVLPGVGHVSVFGPAVVERTVRDWVRTAVR
jgi:acetyl esterase/lipase